MKSKNELLGLSLISCNISEGSQLYSDIYEGSTATLYHDESEKAYWLFLSGRKVPALMNQSKWKSSEYCYTRAFIRKIKYGDYSKYNRKLGYTENVTFVKSFEFVVERVQGKKLLYPIKTSSKGGRKGGCASSSILILLAFIGLVIWSVFWL